MAHGGTKVPARLHGDGARRVATLASDERHPGPRRPRAGYHGGHGLLQGHLRRRWSKVTPRQVCGRCQNRCHLGVLDGHLLDRAADYEPGAALTPHPSPSSLHPFTLHAHPSPFTLHPPASIPSPFTLTLSPFTLHPLASIPSPFTRTPRSPLTLTPHPHPHPLLTSHLSPLTLTLTLTQAAALRLQVDSGATATAKDTARGILVDKSNKKRSVFVMECAATTQVYTRQHTRMGMLACWFCGSQSPNHHRVTDDFAIT